MLKKFFAALLITAASFSFTATSEAANVATENYSCGGYENNYCDYYDEHDDHYDRHHRGGYHGGHGYCR